MTYAACSVMICREVYTDAQARSEFSVKPKREVVPCWHVCCNRVSGDSGPMMIDETAAAS